MKYFRWVELMLSLLLVGTVGELLAPLPSHALTVTIDGAAVQISTTSAACTSGYNLCAFIPPGRYGNWTVGDVSSTNKARIMIGDNSAASSLDLLKLTGITFTPIVTTGTKTTRVVVTHTYNAGGGNPQGDYAWGYGMAGYLDPPSTENIVGDQLQQTGQGNFAGKIAALGLGLDTGKFATPSTLNLNGSVTKSRAAVVVMPACNTGSARCAPTITQTFTLTVAGADKLVLSDSVIAGGGTCHPVNQVIPIPPNLYQLMLRLDPNAPNDINQLSTWLAKMGEKYLKNTKQKELLAYLIRELDKWLANSVPGACPDVQAAINAVIADDLAAELVAAQAAGAVPAEPAPPAPETGTITITKQVPVGSPEGSFTFTATGSGVSGFQIGTLSTPPPPQGWTFVVNNLATGVAGGSREISETPEEGWVLNSVSCVKALPTDGEGDTEWSTGPSNQGPLIVSNLEAGDTLTCTFNNSPVSAGDAVIAIRKQLANISCDGSCAPLTFDFQILGPTNTTASVMTDGTGHGITSVPVNAGTYSVAEDNHVSFELQNSFCSVNGGVPVPTIDFVVPSGASVICVFVNEPQL